MTIDVAALQAVILQSALTFKDPPDTPNLSESNTFSLNLIFKS